MSRPTITVAPVVVSPEIDSKIDSRGDNCRLSVSAKGSAPNSPSTTQNREVMRKPSRMRSSWREPRDGSQRARPDKKLMHRADRKPVIVLSSASS